MSTALVVVVAAASLAGGWFLPARFLDAPDAESERGSLAAWWVTRVLICVAALVFALRVYGFIDSLTDAAEISDANTRGNVVVYGLPDVVIDPAILLGLAMLLHLVGTQPRRTKT